MTRRWLFGRPAESEIEDELDSHVRLAIEDRIEHGEPPAEARRRALLEFGSRLVVKEKTRSVWTWTWLDQLITDLQIGSRILWRAPALSATAVLLIALVIGGNTTVFSVVHGILTKPAPGVTADRLVSIGWVSDRGEVHPGNSYPNYVDLANAARTFASTLAFELERFILTTDEGSYAIQGGLVSAGYFNTLGISVGPGRSFTGAEASRATSGLVAVISHRLWQQRFGESPDIVGRPVVLNGRAATIVGVASPGFNGAWLGERLDVWVPIEAYAHVGDQISILTDRASPMVAALGRLAPGVSLSAAQAELDTISRQLQRAWPATNRNVTVRLYPYSATAAGDSIVAQRGPWFLWMFSVVTALTLLLVCANVANLMLARSVVRAREMAVRQSFGASNVRIVRIFLAEGLAIAATAWVAAALLAYWTAHALPRVIPPLDGNGSLVAFDFTPDVKVLGYALLLACIATVVCSAAPAIRVSRQDLQPLLKAGEQGIVRGRSTMSSTLVVLQLAFSVLLLTTAGLAYRSLSLLAASDLGFDRGQLLLVTINTKAAAPTNQANAALVAAMIDRIGSVPGVVSASYARRAVQSYWPTERLLAPAGNRFLFAERNEVGPGYLRAMGVTPLVGRDLASGPAATGMPAILNKRLAEALWPGEAAVGRVLSLKAYAKPVTIAGVVPDAFYNGFRREADPNFLLVAADAAQPPPGEITLYVRYQGELERLVPAISAVLRSVDARAPIVYLRTMEQQLEGLTWPVHALTILLALFGVGSLLIAAIGQYGAMSFTMRRRIRDFGVRMALGASSQQIRVSVVREGFRLTAAGLAIGVTFSLVAARALRWMLYGVTPTDRLTYIAVFALMTTASLVACYLPAHRASRIDPMAALREE